mmetsp:Transcript_20198/g.38769  ORF Transcript_20198/g.38769 Transcript_20198/m.38769 type:complete len:275 (-) Transcript_20198:591-1415(-)
MWIVFQNVPKGHIVVADRLPSLVAPVLLVNWLNTGHKCLDLHDVMDGRQHQHCENSILVLLVSVAHCIISVALLQHASSNKDITEEGPIHVVVESLPLLQFAHKSNRASTILVQRFPVVAAQTKGEGLGTVRVKTHQPINSEKGAHRPLILGSGRPATGCGCIVRHCLTCAHIERQLWKSLRAVSVKVKTTVRWVPNAPCSVSCSSPVGLRVCHQLLDHYSPVIAGSQRLRQEQRLRQIQLPLGVRFRITIHTGKLFIIAYYLCSWLPSERRHD